MRLVKVTCEIRYAERMRLLGSYEALYRDLLRKEPADVNRWLTPGLRLQDTERKRIMLVEASRSVIDVQEPPNVGSCKDMVLQFFTRVNADIGVPSVLRWGLRSTWIHKYDGSFQELLELCRQRVFGGSDLAGRASDVGAVFDYLVADDTKLSLTVGPMEYQQMKEQFFRFEPNTVPPVFLYADIDKGDTQTKHYSEKHLTQFLTRALEEGEKLAKTVGGDLDLG